MLIWLDLCQQQAGTPKPTSRKEHPGNRLFLGSIVNKGGGADDDIKIGFYCLMFAASPLS